MSGFWPRPTRTSRREIKDGTFRDDLYYRLRVVEIRIPPLRERPEDILPIARFIVKKLATKLDLPRLRFDADCIECLQRYPWPGNVRELENALERAAVLSEDDRITKHGLPACVVDGEASGLGSRSLPSLSLKEVEAAHTRAVLRHTDGNRSEAAKILGIGVTTLWRRLKEMDEGLTRGGVTTSAPPPNHRSIRAVIDPVALKVRRP